MQVSSSWHYCICFSLHCGLQLIPAELAVLVLEEPWAGAFCHCQVQGLRGSLFSKQLRKDVELSFLLPGWGPLCFHVVHELPEFLIQSERSALFWVIAGDHRCLLLADWEIRVSAEWSFSLLYVIPWGTMKLERALLGSLGRNNNQEDCFCRLQEEQGKKEKGEVEKCHKMHFNCNSAPSWLWVGNVL